MIALAEVIDPGKLSGTRVVFGATVKLADTESGDEIDLHDRRRPRGATSSRTASPSAPRWPARMIGREQGDTVLLRNAKGSREYQIVSVKFEPYPD